MRAASTQLIESPAVTKRRPVFVHMEVEHHQVLLPNVLSHQIMEEAKELRGGQK